MSQRCVIQLVVRIDGGARHLEGRYVRRYDPTWHPEGERYDGGLLMTTADRAEAREFFSVIEAMNYYRQAHGTRPWDGKPNRPLTAWTIEIVKLEAV